MNIGAFLQGVTYGLGPGGIPQIFENVRTRRRQEEVRAGLSDAFTKGGYGGGRDYLINQGMVDAAATLDTLGQNVIARDVAMRDKAMADFGRLWAVTTQGDPTDPDFVQKNAPQWQRLAQQNPDLVRTVYGIGEDREPVGFEFNQDPETGQFMMALQIHNKRTNTIGPMTKAGTSSPNDEVVMVDPMRLHAAARNFAGIKAAEGDWAFDNETGLFYDKHTGNHRFLTLPETPGESRKVKTVADGVIYFDYGSTEAAPKTQDQWFQAITDYAAELTDPGNAMQFNADEVAFESGMYAMVGHAARQQGYEPLEAMSRAATILNPTSKDGNEVSKAFAEADTVEKQRAATIKLFEEIGLNTGGGSRSGGAATAATDNAGSAGLATIDTSIQSARSAAGDVTPNGLGDVVDPRSRMPRREGYEANPDAMTIGGTGGLAGLVGAP